MRCGGCGNGKLVWSNGDDADDRDADRRQRDDELARHALLRRRPTQLPDPTYEAAVGVGNAPAYRTRTTIFIEGLNLGGPASCRC
jgi:hypothetical protein